MSGGKIPEWEAELWSYVSEGDGMNCPLYDHCQVRKRGGWCLDENKERINQLFDGDRFDLSSYDFVKRGTYSGVFRMVELLAQRYLKRGGVRYPPVPTELITLADSQHPIEVCVLPLKAYHGAIWCLGDRWLIQLRQGDTPAIQRVTLFHEAFHILAHREATPVFRKKETIQGSFNELLATCFADCILMPRKWVKERWTEVEDVERMAEIFVVPKSAMYIRLKTLHLI